MTGTHGGLLALLTLFASAAILGGCGGDSATKGLISGKVVLAQGASTADALATVAGSGYWAPVDVSGSFRLTRLPEGMYTVVVRKPGWTTTQKSGITIAEGEAADAGLFTLYTTAKGVLGAVRERDINGDEIWVSTDTAAVDQQIRGFAAISHWWIGGKVVRDSTQQYGFCFDPATIVMGEVTAEGLQTTIRLIAAKPDAFAGSSWYISGTMQEYVDLTR